jgi:tetratricopeptide (TPR) repeat protein
MMQSWRTPRRIVTSIHDSARCGARCCLVVAFVLGNLGAAPGLAVESEPLPVPKGTPREHAIGAYNDGVRLMLERHYVAAQQKFETALSLVETLAEAHNNLAFSLRMQGQHNYERALQHYNRALALKPTLAEAYVYRGAMFARRGETERARADHARLLQIAPRLAEKLEHIIAGREVERFDGVAAQYEQ